MGVDLSISIKGLNEAIAKLDRVKVTQHLEPEMRRAVLRLEARMKDYPPAPPTSRYIRRGTLGQRWTHEVIRTSTSLTGKVGNNVAYGPWVQSKRFQTRMHRNTGWVTDEQVLNEERDAIVRGFERALQEAVR